MNQTNRQSNTQTNNETNKQTHNYCLKQKIKQTNGQKTSKDETRSHLMLTGWSPLPRFTTLPLTTFLKRVMTPEFSFSTLNRWVAPCLNKQILLNNNLKNWLKWHLNATPPGDASHSRGSSHGHWRLCPTPLNHLLRGPTCLNMVTLVLAVALKYLSSNP